MSHTSNQDNHIQTNHNQETDELTPSPTTPTISTAAANTVAIEHHASHPDAKALPRRRKQSDDNSNNSNNVRNRREAIALDGLMFDSGSLQDLTQVQEVMRHYHTQLIGSAKSSAICSPPLLLPLVRK